MEGLACTDVSEDDQDDHQGMIVFLINHVKDKTTDTYRNGRATVYQLQLKTKMLKLSNWEQLKRCMDDSGRLYRDLGRCPGQLVPPLKNLTTTSTDTVFNCSWIPLCSC